MTIHENIIRKIFNAAKASDVAVHSESSDQTGRHTFVIELAPGLTLGIRLDAKGATFGILTEDGGHWSCKGDKPPAWVIAAIADKLDATPNRGVGPARRRGRRETTLVERHPQVMA